MITDEYQYPNDPNWVSIIHWFDKENYHSLSLIHENLPKIIIHRLEEVFEGGFIQCCF